MTSPSALLMAAVSDGSSTSSTTSTTPAHLLVAGVLVLVLTALVVLFVAVLVSIQRSRLSAGAKILWVVFVFCVPVLAWFAWYLLGRPDAQRRGGTPVPG